MLPEGTETCRLCGHVLWRDDEQTVCRDCKRDWHVIAQAFREVLPNKASTRLGAGAAKNDNVDVAPSG